MSVIGTIDVTALATGHENILTISDNIQTVFADYPIKERGIVPGIDQFVCRTYRTVIGESGAVRKVDKSYTITVTKVIEFIFRGTDKFYLKFSFVYDEIASGVEATSVITVDPINLVDVIKWGNCIALTYIGDQSACTEYIKTKLQTFYFGNNFYKHYKTFSMNKKFKDDWMQGNTIMVAYCNTELPPVSVLTDFINNIMKREV